MATSPGLNRCGLCGGRRQRWGRGWKCSSGAVRGYDSGYARLRSWVCRWVHRSGPLSTTVRWPWNRRVVVATGSLTVSGCERFVDDDGDRTWHWRPGPLTTPALPAAASQATERRRCGRSLVPSRTGLLGGMPWRRNRPLLPMRRMPGMSARPGRPLSSGERAAPPQTPTVVASRYRPRGTMGTAVWADNEMSRR